MQLLMTTAHLALLTFVSGAPIVSFYEEGDKEFLAELPDEAVHDSWYENSSFSCVDKKGKHVRSVVTIKMLTED